MFAPAIVPMRDKLSRQTVALAWRAVVVPAKAPRQMGLLSQRKGFGTQPFGSIASRCVMAQQQLPLLQLSRGICSDASKGPRSCSPCKAKGAMKPVANRGSVALRDRWSWSSTLRKGIASKALISDPQFKKKLKKKSRQLAVKAGQKLWVMSKRFVWKTGSLTWAFIRNPKIVAEWYEDIRDAVKHFVQWGTTGVKLLITDMRASYFLTKRIVQGYPLKLRERQLLVRTTSDCIKLIPFSFFFIVPFAELALPFVLRLFPNMMPSTFFQQKYDNATLARKLKAKEEMCEFWQQVVEQHTKEIIESDDHEHADKAEELRQFQEKLVEGQEYPSLKEILRFSKLFQSELSLKNMSDKQLSAMSRMLGLPQNSSWWPGHQEVQLRYYITALRREDRDLMWEGVESLTRVDLIETCKKRAIRFHEVTDEEMKRDLSRWLEISANHRKVPTSLLLWIQTFYLRASPLVTDPDIDELKMEEKEEEEKESKPDEAFLEMAERQKAYAQSAENKLSKLRREIDEVMENTKTGKEGTASRNETNLEDDDEEASSRGYAMEEERLVRQRTLRQVNHLGQTIRMYKDVMEQQKSLLDQQLKFLVSMKENKPTKNRNADVILLDQRVRLMEMVNSFEEKIDTIEATLGATDGSSQNDGGESFLGRSDAASASAETQVPVQAPERASPDQFEASEGAPSAYTKWENLTTWEDLSLAVSLASKEIPERPLSTEMTRAGSPEPKTPP